LIENEQDLITATLNGSQKAFDQLMQNYQEHVYRIAFSFGKNQQNAMDITQTTFLKAYENLASYKGKSSFKAWLGRIAYNEGVNWHRKNKHYASSLETEDYDMLANSEILQSDEILAKENKAELLKSLLALNTRYRVAVVMRYFENMPIKEISGILNCSEGMVKNMLHRSLQRLRIMLQQQHMGGIHERM
jgi:RNA polymerase sigma-70 factor (ECF subfamily)